MAASPETQGPFPADGSNRIGLSRVNILTEAGVQREDIRASFAGLDVMAKVHDMALELQLVGAASGCAPLEGAAIYIWHCDAAGRYSIYEDKDRNYLRGVGVSDENGIVRFTTVFPGCYHSRWPHIHFEVFESPEAAVAGRSALVTSKLLFTRKNCAAAYGSDTAYAASIPALEKQSFARDMIFADNTDAQNAKQTFEVSGSPDTGYKGTCVIGAPV